MAPGQAPQSPRQALRLLTVQCCTHRWSRSALAAIDVLDGLRLVQLLNRHIAFRCECAEPLDCARGEVQISDRTLVWSLASNAADRCVDSTRAQFEMLSHVKIQGPTLNALALQVAIDVFADRDAIGTIVCGVIPEHCSDLSDLIAIRFRFGCLGGPKRHVFHNRKIFFTSSLVN
jgi:hypothetical protein